MPTATPTDNTPARRSRCNSALAALATGGAVPALPGAHTADTELTLSGEFHQEHAIVLTKSPSTPRIPGREETTTAALGHFTPDPEHLSPDRVWAHRQGGDSAALIREDHLERVTAMGIAFPALVNVSGRAAA